MRSSCPCSSWPWTPCTCGCMTAGEALEWLAMFRKGGGKERRRGEGFGFRSFSLPLLLSSSGVLLGLRGPVVHGEGLLRGAARDVRGGRGEVVGGAVARAVAGE